MNTVSAPPVYDDGLARRNAFTLAAAQSFGGATPVVNVATGGLIGHHLLGPDKSLATLPVTMFVLGTALGTIPAALLMVRIGRRNGFIFGACLAIFGMLLSAWSIPAQNFWGFCFGTFLAGVSSAFVQQYRFAAADTASPAFSPKAISWVMTGGIVAAIIGPQTVIYTRDLIATDIYAGTYIAAAALNLISILILTRVKISKESRATSKQGGRPLFEIITQPRFMVAVICAIVTYSVMSFVMTATPLAMIACSHSQDEAAWAIQWHVLGMFAPSFFTGSLIARFGKETIMATGMVLLAACGVIALSGVDVLHFWIALVLLGVGWNFGFIGATSMVTECYRPEEKMKVQATNDFLVFGFVAMGSFSAGKVLSAYSVDGELNASGWFAINWTILPVLAACLMLLATFSLRSLRKAPILK
ncbi:MAG: MFS transporter [Hyphomicrobiales bacterium]|nr:MAG: MFS transporter [Hyphomicrobiales bacterium]